jgi:hypothetical protein
MRENYYYYYYFPATHAPHTQAADTQAIAGSQDRAGTKPEAGSMEGDGKTRTTPPCRDNNGKGTQLGRDEKQNSLPAQAPSTAAARSPTTL